MFNPEPEQKDYSRAGASLQFFILMFGFAAPILTFLVAASGLNPNAKTAALVALSLVYLLVCVVVYFRLQRMNQLAKPDESAGQKDYFEEKLQALESAGEFFTGTLSPEDMFRLVSNRVNELFPFNSALLLVPDENRDKLMVKFNLGLKFPAEGCPPVPVEISLAGLAFLSKEVETTIKIADERENLPFLDSKARCAAAIPLKQRGEVYAVLELVFDKQHEFGKDEIDKLTALGDRIAPMFLGSLAYEKSLSSALTDPVTNLPNERAFFMVLENQLAESIRFRDDRPLTVLIMDIKGFDQINSLYGHAFGDKVLEFAADNISQQLRKMDFLARRSADEFLAVLPKASEKTAGEIIERIRRRFFDAGYSDSAGTKIKLQMSFGWATFWRDGETALQLLETAEMRKAQSKAAEIGKVIEFPKEYVN
jgi:diguanylate cyclase (GGDEF)-like protein